MTKKYLIALDDGHGMTTPGKRTPKFLEDLYINGKLVKKKGEVIHENEFNRAVVDYLAKALKRCGFKVLLVAPGDSDAPLKTRVARANAAKADAYISKHYNAVGGKWQDKAKGLVTIVSYNASTTSKNLAKNVHEELWKLHINHKCRNYGVRKDTDISGYSLYVLKHTNMPAILTESGFMDSMIEAVDMLDEKFQIADAEGTCKGICKTFGVTYIEPSEDNNINDNSNNSKPDSENNNSGNNSNSENNNSNNNNDNNLENTKVKYIKITAKELNYRAKPSWDDNAVVGSARKNQVFTVVGQIKVGDSYMYKLKSGYYITSSEKYVQIYNP